MTTIFVPPFQDPQLKQFAQQVVQSLGVGNGTTTQVGNTNPTVKPTDVVGDTYWNSTANNFWIFNNNKVWVKLDTGGATRVGNGAPVVLPTDKAGDGYYDQLNNILYIFANSIWNIIDEQNLLTELYVKVPNQPNPNNSDPNTWSYDPTGQDFRSATNKANKYIAVITYSNGELVPYSLRQMFNYAWYLGNIKITRNKDGSTVGVNQQWIQIADADIGNGGSLPIRCEVSTV